LKEIKLKLQIKRVPHDLIGKYFLHGCSKKELTSGDAADILKQKFKTKNAELVGRYLVEAVD